MFSSEFCLFSKNTFSKDHLQMTASESKILTLLQLYTDFYIFFCKCFGTINCKYILQIWTFQFLKR